MPDATDGVGHLLSTQTRGSTHVAVSTALYEKWCPRYVDARHHGYPVSLSPEAAIVTRLSRGLARGWPFLGEMRSLEG